MNKEKFSTTNRYGLKIIGEVLIPEHSIGLSFVVHPLGGHTQQHIMQTLAQTLFDNNYMVVNFDATHSFGESEGNHERATIQFHYEDLVDIISWSKSQKWYTEPFVLVGYSLGGYAVARYAEEYSFEVKAVFPHALLVSGELSHEAYEKNGELRKWKESGWRITKSQSKPGLVKRLPWAHMEERLKHDLLPGALQITAPILFVVGEKDESCPPEHNKMFFDAVENAKEREFHIVKNAPHTFREPEHLKELSKLFDNWLKKIS